MPPALTSPTSPPSLMRTHSEYLPRFGAADSEPATPPESPSSDAKPDLLAAVCKSSPPYRIPDPKLIAPGMRSPPSRQQDLPAERRRSRSLSNEGSSSPEQTRTRTISDPTTPDLNRLQCTTDEENLGSWLPKHARRIIHSARKRHSEHDAPFSPDSLPSSPSKSVSDTVEALDDVSADVAAAGDAAVLALVAGKCAPAVSTESLRLPDKIKQEVDTSPVENSGNPQSSPTSASPASGRAQYFNLWESDPDNEEAEKVHQWLRMLGLGRYFEQLAAEGFDDMNILANLEEQQLEDILEICPMPKLHEQQLRRGLLRLRDDSPAPDVPPLQMAQ